MSRPWCGPSAIASGCAPPRISRRMPPGLAMNLREIPLAKRGKNADTARLIKAETEALLAAMPDRSRTIALDVKAHRFSAAAKAKIEAAGGSVSVIELQ